MELHTTSGRCRRRSNCDRHTCVKRDPIEARVRPTATDARTELRWPAGSKRRRTTPTRSGPASASAQTKAVSRLVIESEHGLSGAPEAIEGTVGGPTLGTFWGTGGCASGRADRGLGSVRRWSGHGQLGSCASGADERVPAAMAERALLARPDTVGAARRTPQRGLQRPMAGPAPTLEPGSDGIPVKPRSTERTVTPPATIRSIKHPRRLPDPDRPRRAPVAPECVDAGPHLGARARRAGDGSRTSSSPSVFP